ncbi:hypothetical protein STFR1_40428 [Bacillus vallismortis]
MPPIGEKVKGEMIGEHSSKAKFGFWGEIRAEVPQCDVR